MGRGPRQLASLFWKASVAEEVDAELAFHVDLRTRELIARGMTPEAARAAALARFGDINLVNSACQSIGTQRDRDMRRTEYLSEIVADARFALRQLIKSPAFFLIAVGTLALGIGATTAIFSAVEAVVLRPFPYPRPDRLVFALTHWPTLGDGNVSVGDYVDWRQRAKSFAQLGAFQFLGATVANGDSPEHVTVAYATANTFPLYGVAPERGRVFVDDEDQPGKNGVVVLSDAFWRRSLGAASDVVGKPLTIDGRPFTVVGVMPPGFDPTDSHEEAWIPIAFTPTQIAEHDEHYLIVVGRLADGVTTQRAQHELDAITKELSIEFPKTNSITGARLQDYTSLIVGDYRARLFVLLGAVACVLLIACANVANLLLARGAVRSKELAIRSAIGAGQGRIVRQLLTESILLALLATVFGWALAWGGVRLLGGAAPADIPRLASTRIDGTVLAFSLGVAMVSSVVFGLLPALRAARRDPQRSLKEGGRSDAAGARDRLRTGLVAAEVAMALTLLVGAGLLIRSAIYLDRVDPGFDPRGMLSANITLPATSDSIQGAVDAEQTFTRLRAELRARPDVQAVAVTSSSPFSGSGSSNGIIAEGKELKLANAVDSRMRMVSPGYLATMRIPLLRGRDLDDDDRRGGLRVIVLSATLANALWPNQNPIGKRLMCCEGAPGDPRWKTVVGVAADVRTGGPTQRVRPEFYIPMAQAPLAAWRWISRTMTVVARARSGDAVSLVPTLRATVTAIDPSLPVYGVAPIDRQLAQSMAQARFDLILLACLGAVGLLLALAGIYGVIAYFVALRTHEIGIRMALGATPHDVLRLMTFAGARPVLVGATAGVIAAIWSTKLLRGSLYGISPGDPATFAAVIAIMLGVSLAAIIVPARRATRVDPTTALQ
ncbi:MAG: ADOP family duplicated permease [Gemmatimonadales bacterium]